VDIKRRRSVKAEFDNDFAATPVGGSVLAERALRALGVRRLIGEHLPERSPLARYSTVQAVCALMGALLVGGRGLEACEVLRQDALVPEGFGLEQGAPSSATLYRVLCDLSGLGERTEAHWYRRGGPRLLALDIAGQALYHPSKRRIVPDQPEQTDQQRLEDLARFLQATARRAAQGLGVHTLRLYHWTAAFGDDTQLEVQGHCFDAARLGRTGEKILRWHTLMVGPLIVSQTLTAGDCDGG